MPRNIFLETVKRRTFLKREKKKSKTSYIYGIEHKSFIPAHHVGRNQGRNMHGDGGTWACCNSHDPVEARWDKKRLQTRGELVEGELKGVHESKYPPNVRETMNPWCDAIPNGMDPSLIRANMSLCAAFNFHNHQEHARTVLTNKRKGISFKQYFQGVA